MPSPAGPGRIPRENVAEAPRNPGAGYVSQKIGRLSPGLAAASSLAPGMASSRVAGSEGEARRRRRSDTAGSSGLAPGSSMPPRHRPAAPPPSTSTLTTARGHGTRRENVPDVRPEAERTSARGPSGPSAARTAAVTIAPAATESAGSAQPTARMASTPRRKAAIWG